MLCVAIHAFQTIAQFYDDHIKRKDYDYSQLPPHILAQILSQLGTDEFRNASVACKSWYHATSDPRVTKQFRVIIYDSSNSMDYLVRPVHNLRLDHYDWNKHCTKLLQNTGTTIIDLELYTRITMKQLFELFIYLPNIRSFKINGRSKFVSHGNFERSKTITKNKEVIIRNLSQLKTVDIITALRDFKMYRLFLSYCTNIEVLRWGTDEGITDGGELLFNYLLKPNENPSLYKLVELSLENIDRKQNSKFFETMIQLELPNIKRLALKEISSTYYDIMFKQFCKTYRHLDSFTLTGCNEQHLTDICAYMTNLKSFTVFNCTANNLSQLLCLKQLEVMHIERVDVIVDDELFVLLGSEHKLLKKLNISDIDANILKLLCKNCQNLEDLYISTLKTTDCELIFRHLIRLKKLSLMFTESPTKNSSRLRSSDRYNITNLIDLEELYISCYVPGITPELIKKLPKLKKHWEDIWDPSDEELVIADWTDAGADDYAQNDNDDVISEEKTVIYDITDFNWCQELIVE